MAQKKKVRRKRQQKGAYIDWAEHLLRPKSVLDLFAVTSQALSPLLTLSTQLWTWWLPCSPSCTLMPRGLCTGFSL